MPAQRFMVPDKKQDEVWAVTSYCNYDCDAEGVPVVALFTDKQIAAQYADARGFSAPQRMNVYSAMKGLD